MHQLVELRRGLQRQEFVTLEGKHVLRPPCANIGVAFGHTPREFAEADAPGLHVAMFGETHHRLKRRRTLAIDERFEDGIARILGVVATIGRVGAFVNVVLVGVDLLVRKQHKFIQ